MTSVEYRISEINESKCVPICRISGLSSALFLIHRFTKFLPDDSYLVMERLTPSGFVFMSGALSRDSKLSPADCRSVPCLASKMF